MQNLKNIEKIYKILCIKNLIKNTKLMGKTEKALHSL